MIMQIFGAPGGIRTPDQVVRSHLLYPAELRMRNGSAHNTDLGFVRRDLPEYIFKGNIYI